MWYTHSHNFIITGDAGIITYYGSQHIRDALVLSVPSHIFIYPANYRIPDLKSSEFPGSSHNCYVLIDFKDCFHAFCIIAYRGSNILTEDSPFPFSSYNKAHKSVDALPGDIIAFFGV